LTTTLDLDLDPDLDLNLKLQHIQRHDNMEINWKERIARYGYGIDVVTALEEDLEEYVETKIYEYIYENFTDYILRLLF